MKKLKRLMIARYFRQATQLYENEEIEESISIFRKIMSMNPKISRYWIVMIVAFMENLNSSEAFKCIKKLIKFKNISKAQICIFKGDIYFKLEMFKKAYNYYLKAGVQANKNPQLKIRKVRCLLAYKKFKRALITLEGIPFRDECKSICQFLRGVCFYHLGKYRFAINHFNFALMDQQYKENTDLLEMKGNCFYNIDDFSRALIAYQQALAIDPSQEHLKYLCFLTKLKMDLI